MLWCLHDDMAFDMYIRLGMIEDQSAHHGKGTAQVGRNMEVYWAAI